MATEGKKNVKLSELIAKLQADLAANGDSEYVSLGIVATGKDGQKHRLDAVLVDDGIPNILRDPNYPEGMTCLVAEHCVEEAVEA